MEEPKFCVHFRHEMCDFTEISSSQTAASASPRALLEGNTLPPQPQLGRAVCVCPILLLNLSLFCAKQWLKDASM